MARVTKKFADDFDLVVRTWVARGENTQDEVDELRARLRVDLAPGAGLPAPTFKNVRVEGWRPLTHEQRVQMWADTFAGLADEIRCDAARGANIRAEVRAAREAMERRAEMAAARESA